MGALVRLWIREHRKAVAGGCVVLVAAGVSFIFTPFTDGCALWALVLVGAVVLASLHDTSDGGK